MGVEIEKKFLLNSRPESLKSGVEIRQGYLCTGDPEVRIRSKGGKFFATRKGGEGFIRTEDEEEVSKAIFEILWPATVGRRVVKTRFKISGSDGMVWEIDEYHGDLEGLFTAEVELPSREIEAVMPAVIAQVLVADVTEDKRYKNKNLAMKGVPEN